VIQAIRLSQNSDLPQKEATLRLSIGKYTTIQELDLLLDKLCEIVGKLRNVK
jgi:cysteine sulfinate desulfinase/cysteine desulfurase-like protein